ncbi:related to zinc-containing long-chain alcohol dehydrogenase [Rhynchosporium secalis]|uniref:Related to zinc-containing long-chain alcohol dehydrogenase n=1 Tax=Rhynchosporium secalis TaxID=38038 RepID=A0A1E1M679_RHYSE|nr:related to zinc-containing long-chain alcohol dehydrogenase [Rhynchosporium secalis]
MITEALVVHKPGAPFVYQSITVEDQLRDDELLVRIRATGVCHTDLNFAKEESVPGLFPGVFGHEGAGVVVRIGAAVTNVSTGIMFFSHTRLVEIAGTAKTTKAHFAMISKKPISAWGGAMGRRPTHSIVMASSVVKIDRSLPLEDLAPLGCGIMTGAGAMINVVKPKSDDLVCVVGAGAVGLAALMALNLCSSRPTKVIAVDVVPERLELAKKYGATHVINSRELNDLKTALLESTDGRGIDGSIDTTGRPEIVGTLLKATAKKGMVVQVGVGKLTAEVSTSIFDTVNTGRVYLGCAMGNCYPQEFIPMLVAAWKSGDFPFTGLEVKYSAKDMDTAVKGILSGKVIKAIMIWD